MGKFDDLLKKNVSLADHSSYRIGGEASYFALPDSVEDLNTILEGCFRYGLPYYFFGLGSNILFPDEPGKKLFVSLKNMLGWRVKEEQLYLEGGFPISFLAFFQRNFSFTHLLPGTVGAAVYINARCYEGEIGNVLEEVDYLDLTDQNGVIKKIPATECGFGYKRSIFQNKPWVVLGVKIKINGERKINEAWLEKQISKLKREKDIVKLDRFYDFFSKELYSCWGKGLDYAALLKEITLDRERKKQFSYPSCGSVFKNNYDFGVPTGELVERLGLKGMKKGGAMISPYHGNFIINYSNASAEDVKYLIRTVQEKVEKKFGFIPEPEVVIVDDEE